VRSLSLANPLARLPGWLKDSLRDRYIWSMAIVALVVNLGLFAFLLIEFNQLPPLVPLHFDAGGQPDRIEPRDAIFSLPQIGLVMIVSNFLGGALAYRREPLAAYILSAVAITVQFLLWVAAIQIIRVVSA
jgi:hypothetical protein